MGFSGLGQAALWNYQVIIRQSFYHGCYALMDESLFPNPDFWISALYKRLVSTTVRLFHSIALGTNTVFENISKKSYNASEASSRLKFFTFFNFFRASKNFFEL